MLFALGALQKDKPLVKVITKEQKNKLLDHHVHFFVHKLQKNNSIPLEIRFCF